MTEIRAGLNRRLEELRSRLAEDTRDIRQNGPHADAYLHAQRNISELREVESILATMQLADAQGEVAKAQHQVAEAQRAATASADELRSVAEERSFWARRYLTSLTVASAAGFVATLAFMTKTDSPVVPLRDVERIIALFGLGMLVGGLYPLLRIAVAKPSDQPLNRLNKFVVEWGFPAVVTIALGMAISGTHSAAVKAYTAHLIDKGASPDALKPADFYPRYGGKGIPPVTHIVPSGGG